MLNMAFVWYMLIVRLLQRLADKYSRQVGKDKCLYCPYEQF